MLRRLSALAALALCCAVSSVHALGLGEIRVKSGLSQRFSAVVPFSSLNASEAENVRARLARIGQYAEAGIERADYVGSMKVEVVTEDGQPRIEIRSDEIAREPLLNVMIEVRTAGGPRVLRNYTVFLDPPVLSEPVVASRPTPTAAETYFDPAAAPVSPPPPAVTAPAPPEPLPLAEAAPVSIETEASLPPGGGEPVALRPGQHGPVEAGEALWEIASFNAPAGVSQQQAMLAIFEANPQAFADQNINYLKTGVVLDIPDAQTMKRVSQSGAIARLAELNKPIAESDASLAGGAEAATPTTEVAAADTSEPAMDPMRDIDPAESDSEALADPLSVEGAAGPADTTATVSSGTASVATPDADLAAETETGPSAEGIEATAPAGAETLSELDGAAIDGAASTTAATDGPGEELAAGDGASAGDSGAATTESDTEAPPFRSITDQYESAPAGSAESASPMAADQGQEGSMLGKLWVGFVAVLALIAALFGLSAYRKSREARAQREYEEAMQQMQAGGSGAAAAAAAAVAKDREAVAPQATADDEDATRLEDEDATRLETAEEDITAPHPQAGTEDVAAGLRQGTADVDLGDNDPVAEADFHLAYGLYDEAALMLQQAAEREPDRSDIRLKLAETYFAAGNATQFESVAVPLRSELDAEEWGKLAIMGRQLCPGVGAFAEDADASASSDMGVDLNLDEPDVSSAEVDDGLEFKLEELELPADEDPMAVADKEAGLEFDIGDFDLEGKDSEEDATRIAGAGEVKPQDFDLAGSDLETGSEESSLDVNLDELDPDLLDDANTDDASSDDPGTKLDLARAYVEMGDTQMAAGLLDEVEASGDETQKTEAAKLRQRLGD